VVELQLKDKCWHQEAFLNENSLKFNCHASNFYPDFKIIPFVQFPFLSKTVLSGQTHATERLGWESMAKHCWSNWHGLFIVQGFWHDCEMHASLDGQSWSTRHSGSSKANRKIR